MTDAIHVGALVIYAITSAALFVFGINLTRFSVVAWRSRRHPIGERIIPDEELPTVTVQLPIYNERYVAERVIEAACALDYPRHRLQIQVLDDSTDDTVEIVAAAVAAARRSGIDIDHVHRHDRVGFKAGALEAGMAVASGELIAIFDADFVPPPDFLRRAVPSFDDDVAFVQGRWGHLNGGYSWLTRLQVPAIDAHFLVEQAARGRQGHWFNFNGTAGIWRAAAIIDAGGWQHDTLTEDLDLSYRAHLAGWRGRYLSDLVVPGELPAQLSGFRRQQHRWARGSLECARKLLGPIWRSPARAGVKIQATLHLLAYTIHLLLIVLLLSYPLVLIAAHRFQVDGALYIVGSFLAPASLTPAVFLLTGQAIQGRIGPRRLIAVAGLVIVGSGLMLNTARAARDIATKPNPEFERTAKFGIGSDDKGAVTHASTSYRSKLERIVVAELALGSYGLATAALAWSMGSWGIFGYATLFSLGLLSVATTSIVQDLVARWVRRRPIDDRHTDPSGHPPPVDGADGADDTIGTAVVTR